MSGFASRIMAPAAKRMNVVLVLALPALAWMIIAGAAPEASACSASSHCYAEATNLNSNTNHGVYGEIDVHCLYQPNNGNQARAEIWDATSSASNWIEAGIISGVDYNGAYRNKAWVWADQRPGYNYSEHDMSVTANTDTSYSTEIVFAGSNTWDIYGENSFVQFGTSTNNTATLVTGHAGTEYEGGSGSGIRDIGNIYNIQRESSSNVWYSWGGNAVNQDLGSGNYIAGSYLSGSHESWSGPC
jgi:hypothetical protein